MRGSFVGNPEDRFSRDEAHFLLLPLFVGVSPCFCFAVFCVVSSFAIISLGTRELVALLLLCSEYHVAVIVCFTLPRGSMGWSVVYDYGISWSYSLSFRMEAYCLHIFRFSPKLQI